MRPLLHIDDVNGVVEKVVRVVVAADGGGGRRDVESKDTGRSAAGVVAALLLTGDLHTISHDEESYTYVCVF